MSLLHQRLLRLWLEEHHVDVDRLVPGIPLQCDRLRRTLRWSEVSDDLSVVVHLRHAPDGDEAWPRPFPPALLA